MAVAEVALLLSNIVKNNFTLHFKLAMFKYAHVTDFGDTNKKQKWIDEPNVTSIFECLKVIWFFLINIQILVVYWYVRVSNSI